jgi:hypothetical protein
MNRVYVSTANFRSPLRNVQFAGLGDAGWRPGRSYVDTAHFAAPYKTGYFQNNHLFGLGDGAAATPAPVVDPPAVDPVASQQLNRMYRGVLILGGLAAAGVGVYLICKG